MNTEAAKGTLFIIATAIGNLEDMTWRAIRMLGEVDVLACEDTRRTRKIFERYDVPRPKTILSYHEHNAEKSGTQILRFLKQGFSVGLCSDAGFPGISDPGYKIVSASLEAGYEIDVIPGPSVVPTALVASGLPTASYLFKGFPPHKSGPRKKFIEMEATIPHTLVFFESPHRIHLFLRDAFAILGNRRAAVCMELTKKFQQVHRDFLADPSEMFAERKPKGEITVVIAGNHPKFIREKEAFRKTPF